MSGPRPLLREMVFVENVTIPPNRARQLNEEAVERLTESMRRLGLRTPISVRMDGDDLLLVAGRHRLEAAKRLGWERIEAVHIDGDEADARLWEISENLHRAELSPVERAEHIDEWRRLVVAREFPTSCGKIGRPAQGHDATAAALGVSHETVRRAARIAALPQEVRDQARDEKWSQQRLLQAAKSAKAGVVAPEPLEEDDVVQAQVKRLMTAWNAAGAEARERFLERIGR